MAALPGGVTDVKGHENSLQIDDLARFAVDDHNKKEVLLSISPLCFNVVIIFHIIIIIFVLQFIPKINKHGEFYSRSSVVYW